MLPNTHRKQRQRPTLSGRNWRRGPELHFPPSALASPHPSRTVRHSGPPGLLGESGFTSWARRRHRTLTSALCFPRKGTDPTEEGMVFRVTEHSRSPWGWLGMSSVKARTVVTARLVVMGVETHCKNFRQKGKCEIWWLDAACCDFWEISGWPW